MSVKDIRHEFEHQLKVAQDIMRRDHALLSHPDMADKPLEGRPMAAPNSIKGLPGKFRDLLAGLTARAEKMAGEVEGAAKNLHARMDDGDKMKREIDGVAAEMQQILGMDNGGPEITK